MNYGTLAKMKKEFDTYTNANKQHIIYNFNMLKAEGLTDAIIEQLKERIYMDDDALPTKRETYLNQAVDTVNNCLLYINVFFKVVNVYNAKTEAEIKKALLDKVKEINAQIPKYKAIRGMYITEEPLIKTTTNKIKRQDNLNAIK